MITLLNSKALLLIFAALSLLSGLAVEWHHAELQRLSMAQPLPAAEQRALAQGRHITKTARRW